MAIANASTTGRTSRGVTLAECVWMRISVYALAFSSALVACGSNGSTTTDAPGNTTDAPPSPDASNLMQVAFTYIPDWNGVVSVDVIGGFGQTTDWTAPLVSLTDNGDGTFGGTAMVPPGTYPYLFQVTGDNSAGGSAQSAMFARYSLDQAVTEWEQCPAGPTAGNDPNPCSLVTVPQGTPETTSHISGNVSISGSAASKYLVVLERMEPSSHHFFVNRRTTGGNGSYAFDVATGGNYRVQVQNPVYESKKDSQIDPETNDTVRRLISSAFSAAADIAISNADVTPPDYATFEPRTTATLPTTFTFPAGVSAKLDVYGSGAEIGDPWYAGTAVTTGTTSYDGSFNTQAAGSNTKVTAGVTYSWGIEITVPAGANNVSWTDQSLVYPISWASVTN
jgi:hypothetical protein